MGQISGNVEVINHGPDDLFLGDNEFKTETLTLEAGKTAEDGYVLSRDSSTGKLVLATDVSGQVFVLATRDTLGSSDSTASADYAVRVLISGKVKRSGVTISGTALTDAQADALRESSILALDVTSIGKQDNQ